MWLEIGAPPGRPATTGNDGSADHMTPKDVNHSRGPPIVPSDTPIWTMEKTNHRARGRPLVVETRWYANHDDNDKKKGMEGVRFLGNLAVATRGTEWPMVTGAPPMRAEPGGSIQQINEPKPRISPTLERQTPDP